MTQKTGTLSSAEERRNSKFVWELANRAAVNAYCEFGMGEDDAAVETIYAAINSALQAYGDACAQLMREALMTAGVSIDPEGNVTPVFMEALKNLSAIEAQFKRPMKSAEEWAREMSRKCSIYSYRHKISCIDEGLCSDFIQTIQEDAIASTKAQGAHIDEVKKTGIPVIVRHDGRVEYFGAASIDPQITEGWSRNAG